MSKFNNSFIGPCLPQEVEAINRRQLLLNGAYLSGYMSFAKWMMPGAAWAQEAQSFPLQRKLVWINMRGGWDILEVLDPKVSSTSGIDMIYDYNLTNQLAGGEDNARLGRWLPNMAQIGNDLLIVRGLAMGTTSHMAGSVYMDTGILSNTGRVNSASIPAIVSSEGTNTIPIIQLNGGSDPMTDRGLLKPVSVVRAENLQLYRSMYPNDTEATQRRMEMLDYIKGSISRLKDSVSPGEFNNDRLSSLEAAEAKIRRQFEGNVGQQLALTQEETAAFQDGAPANMRNRGMMQTFALAQKLITGDICDCINLGIGGYDTHANQSANLQPNLEGVDFVIKRFVDGLRAAGKLDSTLIVMYTDFGRTPKINNSNGRDHWPVGGALMIGGGIQGGRAISGTDDDMRALSVNTETGVVDENGEQINPTHVGGAVLELTLGKDYLSYRNYLNSIPALTRLKTT
ncbi:MAG: DUF1501 domain-containing protein [Oligoflexales bacterium]|nr:DUF1501 domain-containing protein [Oligoflexales bacterium]